MIAVTGHKFTIGKEEYSPYAVEIQYFRVNKRYWSICFERIRRAGFRIISTVIPWQLHEDSHREFDFSGFTDQTKDLIVFIELAREFGFKIILKPGPIAFAELPNGGLPPFLSKYPEIFALDSNGAVTQTNLSDGTPDFTYPSLPHPRMQNFVKHYLNGLTEIVKNYIYPRGPLFLVELDPGTYFGGDPYPWKSDYNPHIVGSLYPQFLEKRYGDIRTLNAAYGDSANDFTAVKPPKDFIIAKDISFTKMMDWFRFKEWLIKDNATHMIDLYKSFQCEPLFYQTLAFHRNFQAPMTPIVSVDGEVFPTIQITWDTSSTGMLQRIRYLRANSEFPWASSISLGNHTADMATTKKHFPITADASKYILTLSLAGGIKGVNQYKFVETENWYDAPMANDGTIQESFEVVRRYMHSLSHIDIGTFQQPVSVAIAAHRLNNWLSLLEDPGPYHYVQTLNEFTMAEIGRDLDRLKQDFIIPDLDSPASFEGVKNLIVPVTEIMDEEKQEFLVEKAREGANLILVGLLPRFNSEMQNCQVLANAINCKTQALGKIGTVVTSKDKFPSYVFGSINSTARKSKKLATYAKKNVGMVINKFKGTVVLLTFDFSSQGNHMKINFFQNLLSDLGVKFPIQTSHPNVRVFLHKGEKSCMLYILNSMPNQIFRRAKPQPTKVVLQVDLKAYGVKGNKVRLVDIFTNEEIITTADELREGLYFTLSTLDSRAYHLTAK